MTTETTITRVNLFMDCGAWCYAAWAGCEHEHDHNDTLDADSEAEAREEVSRLFPSATISRVADTNTIVKDN